MECCWRVTSCYAENVVGIRMRIIENEICSVSHVIRILSDHLYICHLVSVFGLHSERMRKIQLALVMIWRQISPALQIACLASLHSQIEGCSSGFLIL